MARSSDNPLKRVIHELHRRSLWQVTGIYVAASWVVFEAVQTLTEGLGLPGWFPGLAFVLLLIGFPMVVATAFVQEGGPGRTSEPDAADLDEIFSEGREEKSRRADGRGSLFTWRHAILGGVGAFALWGLAVAGWFVVQGAPEEDSPGSLMAAEETRPAVAVLPFENLSASEENEYFADGIHEAILTNLARVGDLTVLSRTSVMPYEETDKSIRTIAEELGATAVVEGSVQRADDQVRITAQLIEPRSDAHLWANSYDRRIDDVFAVQSEVAREVTEALEANLSPSEEERIERRPTESLSAYDLYLRGRQAYERETRPGNDEAVRLYEEAIAADSSFATAWAGLANAYGLRVMNYRQSRAWADSAEVAARKAVELDPELDEAHKALGLALLAQGRIREGLRENRRAVELNPNHDAAINNIAVTHTYLGRLDESVEWSRRASRLVPNRPLVRANVAAGYAQMGDMTSAAQWLQQARQLDPDHSTVLVVTGLLRIVEGQPGEALEPLLRSTEIHPENPDSWVQAANYALLAEEYETALRMAERGLEMTPGGGLVNAKPVRSVLGYAGLQFGDPGRGRAELRAVLERGRRELDQGSEYPQLRWEMGAAHAALGNRDQALDWLERGYEAGYRWYYLARFDPMLDPVRDEPRFGELMADMQAEVDSMRRQVARQENAP